MILSPFGFSNVELKKIAWLTDLHLDAASPETIEQLSRQLVSLNPDILLIGGDTANGKKSLKYLVLMEQYIKKPLFFVLGNHEFYHYSIAHIRELAGNIFKEVSNLCYLSAVDYHEINEITALIGEDGWCDGQAGDFMNSTVSLHDYKLIDDLKNLRKADLLIKLNHLGLEAADRLEKKLENVFQRYSNIILLTHTPPYQAACIYDKRISNDNWAPHFVCKAMGDSLLKFMNMHPDKTLLVLAGHAHHHADITLLPNLRIIVGESTLGKPQVQAMIQV